MAVEPTAGPLQPRPARYIWTIVKRGPTEIGYAYFRARRRRRNIADDEVLLTESDRLALSGAFDATDAAAGGQPATDRRLPAASSRSSPGR